MAEEPGNGTLKKPTLIIEWDAEKQQAQVSFDSQQFKTWEFVLAVIEMAKLQSETNRRVAEVMSIQKQAAESARVRAILNGARNPA